MPPLVLGIETSCDECSVAVVESQSHNPEELRVLGLSTFSQVFIHQPYGGVVPEIASRHHLEAFLPTLAQALKEASVKLESIDAIAVTQRPGLIGALLVGVSAAKSLSYAYKKPLIPIHHLEGHSMSVFLDQTPALKISYPLLLAIVSGGHTQLHVISSPPAQWSLNILNQTKVSRSLDDAAGEAFDKTAKLLGLPYPGGKWIDEKSRSGNREAFRFPKALPAHQIKDFSFSGLKTSVSLQIEKLKKEGTLLEQIPNLCASIQEAILEMILRKIKIVHEENKCQSIALVGGVAANQRLRELLKQLDCPIFFPKPKYCTDNAAMIAGMGAIRFYQKNWLDYNSDQALTLNATPQ